MYVQIDLVAMGSPLGVLFANFYSRSFKEKICPPQLKPPKCARYVDDILISAATQENILHSTSRKIDVFI